MRHDIAAAHQRDNAGRAKYLSPTGRLLLASVDGASTGCEPLRRLEADTQEVKRLYSRPAFRGRGVGRELVRRLIQEARTIGYQRLLLDSGGLLQAAHALYRTAGFSDVAPYEGREIPGPYRRRRVFMGVSLAG